MTNIGEIHEYLWAVLVLPDAGDIPIAVELGYRLQDPLAVTAIFHLFDDDVTWVFGRELLNGALDGYVGEGDIRAWTKPAEDGTDLVLLLGIGETQARVEFDAAQISDFLHATSKLVPFGHETTTVDVDVVIDSLFAH